MDHKLHYELGNRFSSRLQEILYNDFYDIVNRDLCSELYFKINQQIETVDEQNNNR